MAFLTNFSSFSFYSTFLCSSLTFWHLPTHLSSIFLKVNSNIKLSLNCIMKSQIHQITIISKEIERAGLSKERVWARKCEKMRINLAMVQFLFWELRNRIFAPLYLEAPIAHPMTRARKTRISLLSRLKPKTFK